MLAVERINHNGGIDGRPVELLIRDDKQDPDTARQAVKELLDAGVVAIIGHMTSSMSTTTVPLVNQAEVVMMSPTSTTDALEGIDDYFFRVISSTRAYAAVSADYNYRERGLRRIIAILDEGNLAYTQSWMDNFRRAFAKHGGEVIGQLGFRSSPDTDFNALARRALDSEADGVLILSNSVDAALICQQIRRVDADIPLATSEWAATERLIEMGGTSVEGLFIGQFLDRDSTSPDYVAFRQEYRQRFSREPGFAGVAGYDAASVVLQALAQRPDLPLKQALIEIGQFQGLQGEVPIDRFGDSTRKTFPTLIRNGRFEAL